MKKYLLTLLALFVILAPNVKADSTSISNPLDCFSIAQPSETKNIFSNSWGTEEKACGYVNNYFYSHSNVTGNTYYCINNFIEVDPSTTYTLTHFNSQLSPTNSPGYNFIYLFDSNFKQVFMKQNWFSPPFTFSTTDNSKYFLYCSYSTYEYFNELFVPKWSMQLEKGSISSVDDLSYEEYKVKSTIPEEPDTPVIDATLDNFYSIYLTKLSSLATFATENKIFFSAIVFLLAFIIFELFFMLFLGRRRMK